MCVYVKKKKHTDCQGENLVLFLFAVAPTGSFIQSESHMVLGGGQPEQ